MASLAEFGNPHALRAQARWLREHAAQLRHVAATSDARLSEILFEGPAANMERGESRRRRQEAMLCAAEIDTLAGLLDAGAREGERLEAAYQREMERRRRLEQERLKEAARARQSGGGGGR